MADLIDRDALLKDMGLTDAVKYGNNIHFLFVLNV